ncbi:MAG: hypothetical protein IPN53_19990 [Comamonadaceae bacterium]|nr:hypothetical protein [Comamonadaceae bacterium]
MRYLLIALMIALLPVRAWPGDSMAMHTLARSAQTIEMVAISAHSARAEGTFDSDSSALPLPCHEAAAAVDQASPAASTDPCDHADCAQCTLCTLCQVCHSMVLMLGSPPLPLLALSTPLAHGDQTLLASMSRAPQLKPPIS